MRSNLQKITLQRTHILNNIRRLWQNQTQRVMSITALGMLLALLVDVLIAAKLGTTSLADALIVALTLPRLIESILGEATKLSMVAFLVDFETKTSKFEYDEFVIGLFNLFVLIGIALVGIGWVFSTQLLSITGPGLATKTTIQAIHLFNLSVPVAFFATSTLVLSVLLNSQSQFILVALRNVAMPTVVILSMMLSWNFDSFASWVAVAHSIGYFFYFLVLTVYGLKYTGFRFDLTVWPKRKNMQAFWQSVIYPTTGLAARRAARVFERALATLVAPGAVSAYYFAFRLVSALQSIIGVSLATTGLPKITKMASIADSKPFNLTVKRQFRYSIVISLPFTVATLIFSNIIISLLYGRGAFSQESVDITALVLQYLSLGIIFLSLTPPLNAALYAQQKYFPVWVNQIVNTLIGLLLAWWLSKLWGIIGIAISVVLATLISVVSQLILLKKPTIRERSLPVEHLGE